ncbi:erythromycin esterase family protein [Amycolatopsis sp.]|uniref:erythromycin esterase family protein n=1 Tax=Amycolatopsis sp. TaxID=37632 RepID=UPI002D7EB974|nr:erythromycin esterase family protein [Amycolatopsis sp.]HET6707091.1 erythromycin esterase family protein [Amycolatopsis sp.]
MTTSTTGAPARWINRHAHPLATFDPEGPLTDLAPLRDMVRDASLVALGASARDTHELSVVSHRILRFLVEELGFRSLVLEGDDATSVALDEHVRTGRGAPRALLATARSFWRTGELLDVVGWVRGRNERNPADPVRIANTADASRPADPGDIERLLAENAIRWHEHTGHKIVYWGGVAHTVNGTTPAVHRSAGSYLREHFGSRYRSVGLTFHHGATSYPVPVPPADFAEATLGSAGPNAYLLDLRAPSPAPVRAWLNQPAKTRLLGPGFDPADHLSGGSLAGWFDVIAHCREVTPARPLDA